MEPAIADLRLDESVAGAFVAESLVAGAFVEGWILGGGGAVLSAAGGGATGAGVIMTGAGIVSGSGVRAEVASFVVAGAGK